MPENAPDSPAPESPAPERRPRADAVRNQEAVLAAADRLFARSDRPEHVTMADIAAEAGVGKGTLFRGFGDRTGLIRALFETRLEPVRRAVTEGPRPLGPGTPPAERAPALLDALLCFKLDHRHLSLALEEAGTGSPYGAGHYDWWHGTLRDVLEELPGFTGGDFAAHALLAAVRADLVDHLIGHAPDHPVGHASDHAPDHPSDHLSERRGTPRDRLRADLAAFTARVLGARR